MQQSTSHLDSKFGQCLIASDAEALGRERKARCFGLSASVVLEGLVISALVLFSLADTDVLPAFALLTHVPVPRPLQAVEPVHPPPRQPRAIPDFGHSAKPTFRPERAANSDAPEVDYVLPAADAPQGDLLTSISADYPALARPTPVKPASSAPVPISSGVMEAALMERVLPIYPVLAKVTHTSGTVELRAIIGRDGTVRSLQIVSGNPVLIPAAVSAVQQWRYRPTLLNGVPVEVETVITVKFLLE